MELLLNRSKILQRLLLRLRGLVSVFQGPQEHFGVRGFESGVRGFGEFDVPEFDGGAEGFDVREEDGVLDFVVDEGLVVGEGFPF